MLKRYRFNKNLRVCLKNQVFSVFLNMCWILKALGGFPKRAQNTTPHKTHLQTDLYDTTNCPFGEPDGANVQTRPRPQSVSQE